MHAAALRFSVSDEGAGIPREQHQRIFEPFSQADSSTTREFGGTGLGLAICRELVALMGGSMEVESAPGRGRDLYLYRVFEEAQSAPAEPRGNGAGAILPRLARAGGGG